MLSDEQLEIISETIQPLFQYLEAEVIKDIARRIQKTLTYTRTAELQALSMKKLGYSPARIRKEAMKILNADPEYRKQVAKNTLEYKKEIRDIINEITKEAYKANNEIVANAGDMAWISDLSVWKDAGKTLLDNSFLPQLVQAFADQTAGDLKNMTKTTGFKGMNGYTSVEHAYRDELDKAVIKICSGTFSRDKVIRDTVHNLAQSGLRSVDFESGYSMQLDTAARLAIRTGCHQLAGSVMGKNIDQSGVNLVYVDSHNGARNTGIGHANHEQWQRKVYYIKPGHDYTEEARRIGQREITDLWEATGFSRDGAHENDPAGLYGPNCRHHDHPWFEGISTFPPEDPPAPEPVTIGGKTYDYYAMKQKMRAMERGVRALKREKEALESLGMDTTEIRAKIRRKTKEYKDFCGICNIRPKTERLRYECGTSDLKKTEAWKRYEKCSESAEKDVADIEPYDKMEETKEKKGIEVHTVGKIDKDIYKCITDDIVTDEVIITDERIRHIKERRGEEFYNIYADKFIEVIQSPDYIFADKSNTALACKEFAEDGKFVNVVLRIAVSSDNPEYKNSIITAVGENRKRFQQRLRNNNPLYKKG